MRAGLAVVVAAAAVAWLVAVPAEAQVEPVTVSVSNRCPTSESPGGFSITVTSAVAVPVEVGAELVGANRYYPITPNPIPPFETGRFDGPAFEGGSFIAVLTFRVSWTYTIGADEFSGFTEDSITIAGRCPMGVTTTEPPTTLEAETTTSEILAVEDSSTTVATSSTEVTRSTAAPRFTG